MEKKIAHEKYMQLHLAGKTDQAKADLARLAIVRKKREEAAAKKNADKQGVTEQEARIKAQKEAALAKAEAKDSKK